MEQKAALITGGAHRLGRAMALSLAGRGYHIAVHYGSSATKAHQTVTDLRALGVRAVALQGDLLDASAVEGLVPAARAALGQDLSVLINNASIFEYDSLASATSENWDRHIGSNLRAPFFLTQAFAKQVPDGQKDARGEPVASGCVINMVDQRLRKLTPEFMTYTIAKMGLWGFTQTAAQALAPNIRVNAIGPGPTLQGTRQSKSHFEAQRKATILERGSNPSDVVAAMNFILDSPGFTGQLLCIDGGQHLGWKTTDILGVE